MLYDIISFLLCIFAVLSYYAYIKIQEKQHFGCTVHAIEMQASEQWVENMMQQSGMGVLAIQTLRNAIMSAIFLASTSILPIIGILNLSMREDSLGLTLSPSHLVDLFYNVDHWTPRDIAGIKLLSLLIDFFLAFFSFCLAISLFKQVGFLVNTVKQGRLDITTRYVADLLNRGEHYYNLGMRFCFLSAPLIFWMFGPDFMLAATLGLIYSLYRIDRPPNHLPSHVIMTADQQTSGLPAAPGHTSDPDCLPPPSSGEYRRP